MPLPLPPGGEDGTSRPATAEARGGWSWRSSGLTMVIATLVGLALAIQWVLASTSFGRSLSWPVALTNQLREAWLWGLLVPVVFAVARRFPLHREDWWRGLSAHLAAGLLVAALYSALNTSVIEWFTPDDLRPQFGHGPRRPPPPPPAFPAPEMGGPREPGKIPGPPPLPQRFWFGFVSRLHLNLFTYALLVAIWHLLDRQRRLHEHDRQARELSRQLAEARLQALRMQLNPHFLFNTLNAIATLVHRDPDAADEMIACLSDFLRMTLNAPNVPQSPLRVELEFARRYLDIEKVRFGARLKVEEDLAPECLEVQVPTLVLQPLLENAIRHGIERSEEEGRLELHARHDGPHLVLRVGNSGPNLRDDRSRGGGVGLANTRARLRELHGDLASVTLLERAQGGLDVEVRLPWSASLPAMTPPRTTPEPPPAPPCPTGATAAS